MTRKINLSIRKGSRKIMQDRVRGPETKNLDREINNLDQEIKNRDPDLETKDQNHDPKNIEASDLNQEVEARDAIGTRVGKKASEEARLDPLLLRSFYF